MTVTVTTDGYNLIDDMEDYTLWTGYVPADVTDFYKEGTQCVGFTVDDSGNNDFYRTVTEDLSSTPCIVRFWFMTTSLNELNTDANGGIQIYLSDGTNTGYWYAAGSTTYPGGWYPVCVDVSQAVDAGTKPTAMNAITTFGFRINLTSSPKKTQNVWIDHVCVIDGLIAYGDDAGGYFDFSNIFSAVDNTSNGWPVMQEVYGLYFLSCSLTIGDSVSTNGCKFQATSQRVIFEDRPSIGSNNYDIDVVDNGTGTTEFILGDKSGTAAIQGCLLSVEDTTQTAKFTLDANTDTDVDNFKMYGTTFYGAGAIKFASDATEVEVLSCSFEQCAQVIPDDCATSKSFFINTSDTDAALLWNESADVTDCGFFANTTGAGVEMPDHESSPYDYDALKFSGNTDDVLNSSGNAISISKSNGSDPTSSEGSAVTFTTAAVTVEVDVVDVDGSAIENAVVYLETDPWATLKPENGDDMTDITLNENGASADTVTRTTGSFITDGFDDADFLTIKNSATAANDGTYTIVSVVALTITLSIGDLTASDSANSDLELNGTGPMPFEDIVTISNSGTTATVTHTAHGMLNNDYVFIDGGSLAANRGVFQTTYIGANSYSYTMLSTPGSSPTGTILATFVPLTGLTDATGNKSTTRVYDSNQKVAGWARKSSSSPYYKEAPITGTITSAGGLSKTGVLTSDE